MQFNKQLAEMTLARFYHTQRLNSEGDWNIAIGSVKNSIYPNSSTLMEVLGLSDWGELQKQSRFFFEKYQSELNSDGTKSEAEIKSELNMLIRKEQLVYNIRKHINTLTTSKDYIAKRKELLEQGIELPSFQLIIHYFGKWNNFKSYLSFETSKGKPKQYDREEILAILREHGKTLNYGNFNKKAKELNLPNVVAVLKYVTKDELAEYTAYKHTDTSKKKLLEIAWNHKDYFVKTIRYWREYSNEHKLPSNYSYTKVFSNQELKVMKNHLKLVLSGKDKSTTYHSFIKKYL